MFVVEKKKEEKKQKQNKQTLGPMNPKKEGVGRISKLRESEVGKRTLQQTLKKFRIQNLKVGHELVGSVIAVACKLKTALRTLRYLMMAVLPTVILNICRVSSLRPIFLRAIHAHSMQVTEINRKSPLMQEILPVSNKTLKLYFGGQRAEA